MRKIHNLFIAALVAAVISGCETSDSEMSGASAFSSSSSSQDETASVASQPQTAANAAPVAKASEPTASSRASEPTAEKASESPSQPSESSAASSGGAPSVPDAVPYGALSWKYGGISGGGARQSSASIRGLSMSKNGLSFSWGGGKLSSWGLADGDIGAYACLFVQDASGKWVGGKFDWISGSRSSRDFNNIYSGYGGWNLSNVPNPCSAAFVVISADKKKRTNVLMTMWKR